MKPFMLAAALVTASTQAHALSCMMPDAMQTYDELSQAPETYFVLYGQLAFDEALLPPAVMDPPVAAPAPILARFVGQGLTADGFTVDVAADLDLLVGCAGPWCGSAQSGVQAVIFADATTLPLTVQATPCGGRIFEDPTQAVLDTLTACMQDGACSAQPLQ